MWKTKRIDIGAVQVQRDVVGFSETRHNKWCETSADEGNGFCFRGDGGRQEHGVGFIANRSKIKSVINIGTDVNVRRRSCGRILRITREPIKEFQRKDLIIIQGTGMLRLDTMPMNNGQEQCDALEWDKPMKEEKDFWTSRTGKK